MRSLAWIGIVLLVLGVLAFVVPVPRSHSHSLQVGERYNTAALPSLMRSSLR